MPAPEGENDCDFNPRSPRGERQNGQLFGRFDGKFQSTLPVGGATFHRRTPSSVSRHFNPRSPWGERRADSAALRDVLRFQSTLPVGGATGSHFLCPVVILISIHAPRGGSDPDGKELPDPADISIHAPRGGSDQFLRLVIDHQIYFNPRSPWGERHFFASILRAVFIFQSTLPVGGATADERYLRRLRRISIHAPRGGSDCLAHGFPRPR